MAVIGHASSPKAADCPLLILNALATPAEDRPFSSHTTQHSEYEHMNVKEGSKGVADSVKIC